MVLRVEARDNHTSPWVAMDAWFDERSRARKQKELDKINSKLGWQKYRIRSVLG